MNKRKAFTIVELLIVLVVIALLLSILLPSFSMIRRMAKETAQKAQFNTMDMAIDAFKQDYGDYPPSNFQNGSSPPPQVYCGAQKLTEALLGWDLKGFDPNSAWRRDGFDALGGNGSYDPLRQRVRPDGQYYTLFERRGPYLEVAKTTVFRLGSSAANADDGLYNYTHPLFANNTFDRSQNNYVICDVFGVKKITITVPSSTQTFTYTAGTPILYYKANTSNKLLDCTPLGTANSIYNINDNLALLKLNVLPKATKSHWLLEPYPNGWYFCDPKYKVVDEKIPAPTGNYWPHRPDTYLLISAGADHEFGTNDDILNF